MKTRQIIPFLLAIVMLALFIVIPARGQGGITVTDADSMSQFTVNRPTAVEATASNVPAHYVFYYADKMRDVNLTTIPSALQTLADNVSMHYVLYYVDKLRYTNLAAIPVALQTLTGNVPNRIVLYYADKMRNIDMQTNYPAPIMNDTAPPQINSVGDSTVSGDAVVITWATDEFADSMVMYGTQPGAYSLSASDALLVKQHTITLTQLSAETTYFYQTQSTDRSGNTAHSTEYSFEVQSQKFIYLPLVMK